MGHRVVAHLKGGNYNNFYENNGFFLRRLIRATLRRLDTIIVLSGALRDCFGFLGCKGPEIAVVPNAPPIDIIQEDNNDEPFTKIVLLYLSNMIESKGYWDLLMACKILKSEAVRFHCHFCGEFIACSDDTKFKTALQAKSGFLEAIQQFGLEDQVTYWGVVNGDKKISLLQESHCFILPTNYVSEGQPVSIIEALAYSTAIIATKYRAIPDMIEEGENGFFVDYGDPEKIAYCVKRLFENPDQLRKFMKRSKEIYRAGFTREAHIENVMQILDIYGQG